MLDHLLYRAPFSVGARQCPGARVANLEVHALLSSLVRDWRFEMADASVRLEDMTYFQGTTVQPSMPELVFSAR